MIKELSAGMKVAFAIILLIFAYFGGVTFVPEEHVNVSQADKISSFLQSILTFLIGYYWGTSSKRDGTLSLLDNAAREAAAELEIKRIESAKVDAEKKEVTRIEVAEEVAEEVIKDATEKSEETKA